MSDELTPEQDEAVRRRLAEARHTGPIPADVAARLDEVLAGLSAEDAEDAEDAAPAPVLDLDTARRRRRNVGRVLVAAAAVIVAGVGIGQVVGTSGSSDDSSAGGAASVQQEAPDRGQSQGIESAPAAPGTLAEQVPLQLTGDDLAQQVETQLTDLPPAVQSQTLAGDSPALADPSFSCQVSLDTADGTRVIPAYVDGAAALLALGPAESGPQAARLVDCATGDDLASFDVTLP